MGKLGPLRTAALASRTKDLTCSQNTAFFDAAAAGPSLPDLPASLSASATGSGVHSGTVATGTEVTANAAPAYYTVTLSD